MDEIIKGSFMRWGGTIGILLGAFLICSGVILGLIMPTNPLTSIEITTGSGLISLVLGAKAWQSQAENKPTAK